MRERERDWGVLGKIKGGGRHGPTGPKGARGGGWAGRGGPRRGRGREKKEEREKEKEKEKERKGFFSPFRNPIFLDECTYISKQSKNA